MPDQNLRPKRAQWAGLTLQQQAALWGLAFVGLAAVLYFLSPILAPFVAGTALGYLLDPVADRLQKAGLSRLGAALLLLVLFLLLLAAFLLLIVPILSRQFAVFLTTLPGYVATLQGLLTDLSDKFTGAYFSGLLQKFGLGGAASTIDVQKYINDIAAEAAVLLGDFLKSMLTRGVALINVVSLIVLTPVVAFYMLLDWDNMVDVCDKLVPPRHRADVRALSRDIDKALAGFLRGQSTVCLFLGVWYSLGLTLIGLNFGFLIGVLAGFLSFIPYVGSLTAFVLSITIALVQAWPDWRLPLEAIAVVSAGLFLDGNVLSPRLVGGAVGLHPVWIMFALFSFGSLFGFSGLILAVPVAAALGVILRFVARRYRASALYSHPETKA
jgi:predicted PurR-regulated permease PerM